MATYHYSPLPADGSSIRLFRLLPASDPSADIISELFHSSVVGSDHIPYEALSYTWGDPNQTTSIKLNGHQFAVTRNLHGALLALRHSEKPRMLWIDAVCINQSLSAREERGRQVRMMWQIYKAADCVIVWLGPEEWDSATAMENISKRETQRRLLARNCEMEMPRGTGVLNLIERRWFRRVWVLQEVAAAKKLVVVCGKNVVQGSDFYQELISTVEWFGTFSKIVRKIRPALEFMNPSSTALRQRQYRLVELMEMFRSWEATEPLDKVYALLEFSSDAYNAPDLCPDYTISKYELARKLLKL
ncbi:heterokaryon incompatibility protein-domain-containing protein, partial [Hyaloscypha sp. PMI_1271]